MTSTVDKLGRIRSGSAAYPLSRLRLDQALSGRELLVAWIGLAAVATATFLPHILHGGFYLDDWSNGAVTLHSPSGSGFGNILGIYAELTLFRPVLILYAPLTFWVFGMHAGLQLAWAAFLAFAVSALLYAVLRTVGLAWVHALLISALTLLYPWFDSIRLWATAGQISFSTALALAGLWIALVGLQRDSWRWHIGAAALYLLSILTYEITLPVIAGLGILYWVRFDWARARWRWAADIGVVGGGGAWVLSHTARSTSGVSANLDHARQIAEGGATILGRTVLPIGPERTALALLLLALALTLGGMSWWLGSRQRSSEALAGLRGWLLLAAAGAAVVVLGWVVFVPADPYYSPQIWGMTNRVNGIAGIGAVILVYAGFGIVGTLVAQVLYQRVATVGLAVTLVLGVLLASGYLSTVRRHIGIWNAAYQAEKAAIGKIEDRYPTLPPGTTVFATGYPAYQTIQVPILSASWDLNGMLIDEYEVDTLGGAPLLPGFGFSCGPDRLTIRALGPSGSPTGEQFATAEYGRVRVIDLAGGSSSAPRDRASCIAGTKGLEPGPFALMGSY